MRGAASLSDIGDAGVFGTETGEPRVLPLLALIETWPGFGAVPPSETKSFFFVVLLFFAAVASGSGSDTERLSLDGPTGGVVGDLTRS